MALDLPPHAKAPARAMPLFERRRLTDGEITLGRAMFADEIDWRRVRVAQGPPIVYAAMVPFGRTIWFGRWRAAWDFSREPEPAQGWFVHELAHVWQSARGVVLAYAKLRALTRKAYALNYAPERAFGAYNIEAQAEIARLLFLARRGAKTEPGRDALEALWARRNG